MTIEEILLKFQKKVKFRMSQKLFFKKQFNNFKLYFLEIISNINELNQYNYFKNEDKQYSNILKKMEEIKNIIIHYENNLKTLKYYKILILHNKLLTYSNILSSSKIISILNLINNNWENTYKLEELNIINFLNCFVRCTFYWDSLINSNTNLKKENKTLIIPNNNIYIKNILSETLLKISSNTNLKDLNKISSNTNLKDLNIEVKSNSNDSNEDINTNFDLFTCERILNNKNIYIDRNKTSDNLIDNKYGCSIFIRLVDRILVVQGIFNDDLLNMSESYSWIVNLNSQHINNINQELLTIPTDFKKNYYNIINLRDKIILSSREIINEIKKKYNDFKQIQNKPLMLLINEFLLGSKLRKIDILTLFLISTEDDQKLAAMLFDVFKSKDKKNLSIEIYNSLHYSIRVKIDIAKLLIENEESELISITESDISYEKRILLLNTNQEVKSKAMDKLKLIKTNFQGDSKAQAWLDGLLKIPFNIYNENEIITFKKKFIKKLSLENINSDNEINNHLISINNKDLYESWKNYNIEKNNLLQNVKLILDDSVYGHSEAKIQIQRIFAQWISGDDKGAIIGLQGPPGTGKTSLIKNGLSKCLKDANGNVRPFAFLPIGGSVNGSTLVGHNYTYVGSTWGRIIDILISTKCMNPIIFIDELDKVSMTEHGREIISILTHLTDSTQNDEFEDKFFAGIKFDLSKVLIIFSFNDIDLIDPILKDRITIIETKQLDIKEKIIIIKNYLLPEILTMVGFAKNEVLFDDNIIKYIIETYTLEAGVRKLKEKIIEIIRDINLQLYFDNSIILPINITKKYCDQLFDLKPKIKIKKIISKPSVGIVNGLYASTSGIGGITFIQAIKFPSDKFLELHVTGALGDVMKESMEYALKLAFSILPDEYKNTILEEKSNKKLFGIHLHCPEGAVKKDGPSAGAAITLVIYSLLTNIKINNEVALTGEIDLIGNITAIGGLQAKLNGAKNAGVKLALYPSENQDDIDRLRKENLSPEDENFNIMSVSHISEVINLALIN